MTYIGKIKVGPNHPFAHDQISFVPNRSSKPQDSVKGKLAPGQKVPKKKPTGRPK
jgi:hypothetical protein